MTRPTSWEAYKALEESGGLSKQRLQVLHFVFNHPNHTPLECTHYYSGKDTHDRQTHAPRDYTPRFAELVKLGLIYETGTKFYADRNRITYDVTGALEPVHILKRITKREQTINILKEALEDIIKRYRNSIPFNESTKHTLGFDVAYMVDIARAALLKTGLRKPEGW